MRVNRRRKLRISYTDKDKRTLLTGVGFTSDRFGHPKLGWDREGIRAAWDQMRDELRELWQTDEFAEYRERYGRPFAERFLAQDGDHYPFSYGCRKAGAQCHE